MLVKGLKKAIALDIFCHSNVGGRRENEDMYGVFEARKKEHCFVVADGLGGHGGGARASKAAVDMIGKNFMSTRPSGTEDLSAWFREANRAVLDLQTPACRMKTTLVTLYIRKQLALWAHVGDSRLYHFVDGKIMAQTMDHSVSQMAVIRGEITKDEIRGHEDRNRLLRALGSSQDICFDVSGPVNINERKQDFLLCTDGFWEYIYEKEMEEALFHASNAKEWMERMLMYLKKRAKSENDNYTAITVRINR